MLKYLFLLVLLLLRSTSLSAQSDDVYWIAFVGTPQNTTDAAGCSGLCIVRSDGTELHELTRDIKFSSQLAWSPDGEWIAYTTDSGDLQRMSIKTGEIHTILTARDALKLVGGNTDIMDQQDAEMDAPIRSSPVRDFIWSNDGESLYFAIQEVYGMSYSPANLHSIQGDGSNFQTLVGSRTSFSIHELTLSPNRETIIFREQSRCRYCDFWGGMYSQFNTQNQSSTVIAEIATLDSERGKTDAHWSRDGGFIYLVGWRGDYEKLVGDLLRIDVDTLDLQIISAAFTDVPRLDTAITFNFYYVIESASCAKVKIIALDTGEHSTHPDDNADCFEFISPSPVDNRVALSGGTAGSLGGEGIYIMDAAGIYTPIIRGFSEIYSPAWSPVPIEE